MVVHAAFGGSTNLLLHIPAIAYAAGLQRPTVDGLGRGQSPGAAPGRRAAERSARPFATVRVFLAGGVPEVMLHLRRAGLLDTRVLTVTGETLDASARLVGDSRAPPRSAQQSARRSDGIDPDDVIMTPDRARDARPDLDGLLSRRAISRPKARSSRARPSIQRGRRGRRLSPNAARRACSSRKTAAIAAIKSTVHVARPAT